MRFLTTWLEYCCDKRILTDIPNTCGKKNLPEFKGHRRDQSVLSLLAQRHSIPLYRIPTQFGNHYKMHGFRLDGEFNCIDQLRQEKVGFYAPIPYNNSPYFQLLDHHRGKKEQKTGRAKGRLAGLVTKVKSLLHRVHKKKS